MNTRDVAVQERIPPDRLAEAGVWIARLHGDDRSPAMEEGFREWLNADPMNARAFELTTDVWEDAQNLRRVIPFAHEAARPARSRSRILSWSSVALVGAVALVLAVVAIRYFDSGTVATGVGEQRLLALEDGSRIFLNTATRVAIRYNEQSRLVELEAGEALFDVAKQPHRPFIVRAGDRQVRAVGTSFVVRRDRERLAVTLVEGKVAVMPVPLAELQDAAESSSTRKIAARSSAGSQGAAGTAEVFTLTTGQRLVIPVDEPARVDTLPADRATAWRRGQVILDDTALANAVTEMNRYSAQKLVVESSGAQDLVVSGLFQVGDSVSFAHAVAQTYGLTVIERRNEIVLSGNPQPESSRTDAPAPSTK
jgi:transmembrane sensor